MEDNKELTTSENKETDIANLSMSPEDIQERLIKEIIECKTPADLQKHLDLFNFAQTKNNVLKTIKFNKLEEKVMNQIIERFEKKPDQMSNRDLLDYLQAITNQIEKSKKSVDVVEAKPVIEIHKTEVNMDKPAFNLTRDGKERVTDFVNEVINQLVKNSTSVEEQENAENIVMDKADIDPLE